MPALLFAIAAVGIAPAANGPGRLPIAPGPRRQPRIRSVIPFAGRQRTRKRPFPCECCHGKRRTGPHRRASAQPFHRNSGGNRLVNKTELSTRSPPGRSPAARPAAASIWGSPVQGIVLLFGFQLSRATDTLERNRPPGVSTRERAGRRSAFVAFSLARAGPPVVDVPREALGRRFRPGDDRLRIPTTGYGLDRCAKPPVTAQRYFHRFGWTSAQRPAQRSRQESSPCSEPR